MRWALRAANGRSSSRRALCQSTTAARNTVCGWVAWGPTIRGGARSCWRWWCRCWPRLLLQAERAYGLALGGFGTELAILAEIVPEEQGAGPPFGVDPAAQIGELAFGLDEADSQRAGFRIVAGYARVGHQQTLDLPGFAVLDDALFAGAELHRVVGADANGVFDRPGDGNRGGVLTRVVDTIAQDGDGQPGFFGIERDEGAESIQRNVDGQAGIAEGDLGDGELAGESCAFEAAEAGRVLGAEAIGTFVGRHEAGLEHVRDGLAAAGLRPEGGESVLGRAA